MISKFLLQMKVTYNPPSQQVLEKYYQQLGVTPESLQRDVETLREWLQKQPHLPDRIGTTMYNTAYFKLYPIRWCLVGLREFISWAVIFCSSIFSKTCSCKLIMKNLITTPMNHRNMFSLYLQTHKSENHYLSRYHSQWSQNRSTSRKL